MAAVAAVLLLLVGGAALAVGGGSDEEDALETATTSSTTEPDEDPAPDEDGAGEGTSGGAAALDGTYDVTAQDVEAFSYAVNSGGTGGPLDVGGSSDGIVMVSCSGSSCVVDALGGLFPSFRGELDGSTITGEVRRPFGSDPACAGQEQVDSVELTISDDGALTGEHVRDVVPGEVACGGGVFQSGSRYVSRLTGERE